MGILQDIQLAIADSLRQDYRSHHTFATDDSQPSHQPHYGSMN